MESNSDAGVHSLFELTQSGYSVYLKGLCLPKLTEVPKCQIKGLNCKNEILNIRADKIII